MSLKSLSVICTHPLVPSWKPSLLRGWQLTLTSTGETFLGPTLSVWDCGSFKTIILQVLEAKTGTSMEESDGCKPEQKWNYLTFSPTNVIFWNFKPKRYHLEFQAKMWSSQIASKNVIIWNFHQKGDFLKFQTKMQSPEISNQIRGLNLDAKNRIICVFFIWYHFNLSINQLLKNCRFHSKIWSSVDVLLFWARHPQTK